MLTVEKIDTQNKTQVRRFIQIPFRLYAKCPQWVPPLLGDAELQLNRAQASVLRTLRRRFFYRHARWTRLSDASPRWRIGGTTSTTRRARRNSIFSIAKTIKKPRTRSSIRFSRGRARAD